MENCVIINDKDNVGINLAGNDKIPAGHKFALRDIKKGEYVIKYGEIIVLRSDRCSARKAMT